MSKRNNIDRYLEEPETSIPSEEFSRLEVSEQEEIRQHQALDRSLRSTMHSLASHSAEGLYSEEQFSKMLLNRLESESAPETSSSEGPGIINTLKTLFSPGLPLYAGGGLAAAAAVLLAFLFFGPGSSQENQVATADEKASEETGAAMQGEGGSTDEDAVQASDGPRMMAESENDTPPQPNSTQQRPEPSNQVAVAPQVQERSPATTTDEAKNSEQQNNDSEGEKEDTQVATNLPQPETAPPVEGSEELSEEVRRGLMNERYAAAFSKEMQLKRKVRNAGSEAEKRKALNDLLDYYKEKGQSDKAEEVKKEIAELN